MIRDREMIYDKTRRVRNGVLLASVILRQPSESIPNLIAMAELAIKRAGISWEWIDVTSIALSPTIPSSIVKTFKDQYRNVFTCDNLIYAIAGVRDRLLKNSYCCFGLTLVVENTPNQDKTTVGVMVWKKPNYIDSTRWLPEGIVSLTLNSDSPDIVQTTINKVNAGLRQRQEPPILRQYLNQHIKEIVVTTKDDAVSLARFLDALSPDNLAMLVLNHGKTRSAVLIQT